MRGKVTRDILENAFGSVLLKAIEDYRKDNQRLSASASMTATGRPGEKKSSEEDQQGGATTTTGVVVDALAGTDTVAGKLQVRSFVRSVDGVS